MHMIKTGPHRTGTISICLLMNILGLIFSPYLFLFAMEALSQLLSCARNGGFISGFRVGGRGREGLIVSHLLFGDDTLIFCDAEADQLQYLSWTFMWFEAILGLKVNLSKTEAFPLGEGILMETLASVLGCKIGSLPTTYLVSPLEPPTNPSGYGTQWKKDSGKGCLSGKGNTFPKAAISLC